MLSLLLQREELKKRALVVVQSGIRLNDVRHAKTLVIHKIDETWNGVWMPTKGVAELVVGDDEDDVLVLF